LTKYLKTPVTSQDISDLTIGDIIYLSGTIITGRDAAHKRYVEKTAALNFDLGGGAIFHAGPIVIERDNRFKIVSVGPTTSMRMESVQAEFLRMSGAKIIIGKGGMGDKTKAACKELKCIHTVYPGGCAVLAASQVEEVEGVEWSDLGMPEAAWICRVKDFGPLIVTIDTKGENLFEKNKKKFEERKINAISKLLDKIE